MKTINNKQLKTNIMKATVIKKEGNESFTLKVWIPERKIYVFYTEINSTTYKCTTDENRPSTFYMLKKGFSAKKIIALDGEKY
jgi:hypothetical protein